MHLITAACMSRLQEKHQAQLTILCHSQIKQPSPSSRHTKHSSALSATSSFYSLNGLLRAAWNRDRTSELLSCNLCILSTIVLSILGRLTVSSLSAIASSADSMRVTELILYTNNPYNDNILTINISF